VLSGRGLCDELITRPGESYRLCCVVVCDLETSRMGAPNIYDISHLRVKRQAINLRSCCILLADSVESMMMHEHANPKFKNKHINSLKSKSLGCRLWQAFFLSTSRSMKDGETSQTSTFPLNYGKSWRRGGGNYACGFKYGITAFK